MLSYDIIDALYTRSPQELTDALAQKSCDLNHHSEDILHLLFDQHYAPGAHHAFCLLTARLLKILFSHGFDANSKAEDGSFLLHKASASDSVGVLVELIIEMGGDVNLKGGRLEETPLHLAARKARPQAVEILLNAGACPETLNGQGLKPLHFALGVLRHVLAEQGEAHEDYRLEDWTLTIKTLVLLNPDTHPHDLLKVQKAATELGLFDLYTWATSYNVSKT